MEIKIKAEVREKIGAKGTLSSIRAEKKVPAVVYGGDKAPISISLTEKDLAQIIKTGSNAIVNMTLPSGAETVIVKAIQYHVVKDTPNHVDFQRISMDKKIDVVVPVKLVGICDDAKTYGAIISHVLREVTVRSLPADIPNEINVDLKTLTINKGVTAADLVTPNGVEVLGDPGRSVVHLMVPKEEEVAATAAVPGAAAAPAQPESSNTKGKKDEEGNLSKEKKA